jgi:hypothetical protein
MYGFVNEYYLVDIKYIIIIFWFCIIIYIRLTYVYVNVMVMGLILQFYDIDMG